MRLAHRRSVFSWRRSTAFSISNSLTPFVPTTIRSGCRISRWAIKKNTALAILWNRGGNGPALPSQRHLGLLRPRSRSSSSRSLAGDDDRSDRRVDEGEQPEPEACSVSPSPATLADDYAEAVCCTVTPVSPIIPTASARACSRIGVPDSLLRRRRQPGVARRSRPARHSRPQGRCWNRSTTRASAPYELVSAGSSFTASHFQR